MLNASVSLELLDYRGVEPDRILTLFRDWKNSKSVKFWLETKGFDIKRDIILNENLKQSKITFSQQIIKKVQTALVVDADPRLLCILQKTLVKKVW